MMIERKALPPPVQEALRHFDEAGVETWLVGGATRDLLLGRPVKDFDLVTGANGMVWARRLADLFGGAFVPLDEARGVGRAVIRHEGRPLWIDVASFRDAADAGGGSTLDEDLRYRDFTVNAIAWSPKSGRLVDPTGGAADLGAKRLRMTGPAALRQDPLRLLRGVRLTATHDLSIEPETWQAMADAVPALAGVAAERIRVEWMSLLTPSGAAQRVEMLDRLGVIALLMPELAACRGVTQSPPHHLDVFAHQLRVLAAIEGLWPAGPDPDPLWQDGPLAPYAAPLATHLATPLGVELSRRQLLKQAALLHDIGKPATRTVGEAGRIHFYGHENVGARLIEARMRALTFSARAVAYVTGLVRHHLRPLHLSGHLPPSHRAVYRYFRDCGDLGPDLLLLALADQRGKDLPADRPALLQVVAHLLAAYFDRPERYVRPTPLINGRRVIELTGLTGPAIGRMLESLREAQANGTVTSRAAAEAFVLGRAQEDD